MAKKIGLERIIYNCCNIKTTSFDELRSQIITNLNNCDLTQCSISALELSELKESNGRKLIMTRPKFRQYFRRTIYIALFRNKMVKEKGYDIEDVIFNDGLNRDMVEEMIEPCLKIFIEKQKALIWKLEGLNGNCELCIVKEVNHNIYLFDVDYKKIFNWIFNNFQKIKNWKKENIKEELNKEDINSINNDNFENYMNFEKLKTYSELNPMLSCHWNLCITINIIKNKMYIGGLDIECFDGSLHQMFKAAYLLHINNLNFKYLEAEDESGDFYEIDFNLEEISKLLQ